MRVKGRVTRVGKSLFKGRALALLMAVLTALGLTVGATGTAIGAGGDSQGAKIYVLTNTLEANKNYLIVNTKTGSGQALTNALGSSGVTINAADDYYSGGAYIQSASDSAVWAASAGVTLKNGGKCLEVLGDDNALTAAETASNNASWTYAGTALTFTYTNDGGPVTKYLVYNGGWEGAASAGTVYLFVETDAPVVHTHTYGTPTYTWDDLKCTAEMVCSGCEEGTDGHKVTETVTATLNNSKTVKATCTSGGKDVYTATFTNKAFASQDKEVAVPATGHAWGKPTYEWVKTDSGYNVTATRVCGNDSSHKETETVGSTYKVITEPGCETKGEGLYTSGSFSNTAFEVQTKTVGIPATGHDWGNPTYTWSDDNSTVTAKRVCKTDASHVETEQVGTTYKVVTAAGCENTGEGLYTSKSFKNTAFTVQTKAVIIPITHQLVGTEAKPATFDEDGNSAYWTCTKCGRYFSDAEGTKEIEEGSWVITKHGSVNVYRLYNTKTSEHLYTTSEDEYNAPLINASYKDWKQEGIAWVAPAAGREGSVAVYRLYNKQSGDHHYTTNNNEMVALIANHGWSLEGVVFYSGGNVDVYGLYNGGLKRGQHHFTGDTNEVRVLVSKHGWKNEGVKINCLSMHTDS